MKILICVVLTVLFCFMAKVPALAAFPTQAAAPVVTQKAQQLSVKELKSVILKKNNPKATNAPAGTDSNTLGLLSMIFGIAGLVFLFLGPLVILSPFLAIAGIVLGALGMKQSSGRGMAIAGLVLGIVTITLLLLALAFVLAFGGF